MTKAMKERVEVAGLWWEECGINQEDRQRDQ